MLTLIIFLKDPSSIDPDLSQPEFAWADWDYTSPHIPERFHADRNSLERLTDTFYTAIWRDLNGDLTTNSRILGRLLMSSGMLYRDVLALQIHSEGKLENGSIPLYLSQSNIRFDHCQELDSIFVRCATGLVMPTGGNNSFNIGEVYIDDNLYLEPQPQASSSKRLLTPPPLLPPMPRHEVAVQQVVPESVPPGQAKPRPRPRPIKAPVTKPSSVDPSSAVMTTTTPVVEPPTQLPATSTPNIALAQPPLAETSQTAKPSAPGPSSRAQDTSGSKESDTSKDVVPSKGKQRQQVKSEVQPLTKPSLQPDLASTRQHSESFVIKLEELEVTIPAESPKVCDHDLNRQLFLG